MASQPGQTKAGAGPSRWIMATETVRAELLSIIAETENHLEYLSELGVETCDADQTGTSGAPRAAFNRQSAGINTQGVAKPTPVPLKASPDAPASRRELTTSIRASIAAKANPLETLFGDIFQPPEDRLPESNETFEVIHADIGDCTRCPLSDGRTHVVHTEGNRKARLMFVGEAPGADEDAQARPFVGRAGQLLTKIIEAIGLKREEVLIGNVNRCRPPGNRAPTQEEASMCKPFLLREIAVARPEVIVVLGNTAMKNLLDTKEGITRLRGRLQNYKGIKVMPTFHPAYLLRDPSKKRETWEDLKKVRDYLDSPEADRQ